MIMFFFSSIDKSPFCFVLLEFHFSKNFVVVVVVDKFFELFINFEENEPNVDAKHWIRNADRSLLLYNDEKKITFKQTKHPLF